MSEMGWLNIKKARISNNSKVQRSGTKITHAQSEKSDGTKGWVKYTYSIGTVVGGGMENIRPEKNNLETAPRVRFE